MGAKLTTGLATTTRKQKAKPNEHLPATPEEAQDAYLKLTAEEKSRLLKYARHLTNDELLRGQEHDLISEAFCRVIRGSRIWNRNNGDGVSFYVFFCGVMDSIAFEWRRPYIEKNEETKKFQRKNELISLDDSLANPEISLTNLSLEKAVEAETIIQKTYEYFSDDGQVQYILVSLMCGYSRRETIEAMGIDLSTYSTIFRRLNRHLNKLEEQFGLRPHPLPSK